MTLTRLPEAFLHMLQELLGTEEYPAFLASYDRPSHTGLRVNSTKISTDIFSERVSFPVEPVPWIGNGFFCGEDSGASRHPWYYGGVYYIQEPSAMTPASLLPVEPGDRVLDLWAARRRSLPPSLKGGEFCWPTISASPGRRACCAIWNGSVSPIWRCAARNLRNC